MIVLNFELLMAVFLTLMFVFIQFDISQYAFSSFMPIVTDVIFDIVESLWLLVQNIHNFFTINENLIEILQEVVWSFQLNLSGDNSGVSVSWQVNAVVTMIWVCVDS